ncbi:MAG: ribose 1,5-bisphosphokinase [Azoarcus sp.]|jgi:ribose 1,5-bisphosphokinase|nr:ribose 1,5-bisphosphokinase [Azoarcus sp.]
MTTTQNNRLIYLMGPSGAGKDTLLSALRQDAAARARNLLIAHRYITRPPAADDCEQHVFLYEQEFERRRQRGLFALDWHAHGHAYAAGMELDLWMDKGFSVILNGSRQHLPTARQKYAGRLIPVCLTVSAATLAKRLIARGRENAREIEARLFRAQIHQEHLPPDCHTLDNEGGIQDTARRFLSLIEKHEGVPSHPS